MRIFASFFGAFVLSLVTSQIAAQQMAIYFEAREEFIAVMTLLILFTFVSIAIFAVAYGLGKTVVALDRAACALVALAIMPVSAVVAFDVLKTGWTQLDKGEWQTIAEMIVPALVVIGIQWWWLRRLRERLLAQQSARPDQAPSP